MVKREENFFFDIRNEKSIRTLKGPEKVSVKRPFYSGLSETENRHHEYVFFF